ncbi:MAG TPA: Gfo/Idh/MocA family oxidoreductase [Candidatus Baltobacteraceae bacterium]|nr:Gfo/Idh/MocA family oxidoreductase [Candidatus Baltobacteraceae bacterium]
MNIGLIGLDTSHVEGFAGLLNDPAQADHLPGGRIVAAYPGGSPDFPLSIDRVPKYTEKLRDQYGVTILESPQAVAEAVDAVILTSVDGRVHLRQFEAIAPLRKPVFVDKPFATTTADARGIVAAAARHGTPIFSSSSLRFAGALQAVLADGAGGPIIGADFFGPLHLQPTQPGFFWYGIHTAEMLFAALGPGCAAVRVTATPTHELAIGTWRDGRLGVIRGNRSGNNAFGGVVHREAGSRWVDVAAGRRPDLGLTVAILEFFRGGPAPVPAAETLELTRFLEAANESRDHGGRDVTL